MLGSNARTGSLASSAGGGNGGGVVVVVVGATVVAAGRAVVVVDSGSDGYRVRRGDNSDSEGDDAGRTGDSSPPRRPQRMATRCRRAHPRRPYPTIRRLRRRPSRSGRATPSPPFPGCASPGRRDRGRPRWRPTAAPLVDQLVDPPPLQELRLRGHGVRFGKLVEGDLHRDVLAARIGEVVVTALVPAIRAQPLPPRAGGERRGGRPCVVDDEQPSAPQPRPSLGDPADGGVVQRCPRPVRRRERQVPPATDRAVPTGLRRTSRRRWRRRRPHATTRRTRTAGREHCRAVRWR